MTIRKEKQPNQLCRIASNHEIWKWKYLEEIVHKTMSFFDYSEIRPPLFVSEEAVKQVYDAENHRPSIESFYTVNDNKTIYLRPDGTLTHLDQLIKLNAPIEKELVYYIGPMFRRLSNKHDLNGTVYQFGAEAIGNDSYVTDVEIIQLGLNIFRKLGLSNIHLEINSYGCDRCRPFYEEKIVSYWQDNKDTLCSKCSSDYHYYINHSDECNQCQAVRSEGPVMLMDLCEECSVSFSTIKKNLSNLMLEFVVNPHLSMSFPYYNQLIFQYKIPHENGYKLLGGGGRYNELLYKLTDQSLCAVGFSANMDLLLSLLESSQLLIDPEIPFQVYVMATDNDLETTLLQIAKELRDNEIKVVLGKTEKRYDKQALTAQKKNCSLMVIISEEAIREGRVTINNLIKNHIEDINLRDILTTIIRLKKSLTK